MMRDDALKLLKEIDSVEADMRALEGRLTRVRMTLHRLSGVGPRYDANGQKLLSPAEQEALNRFDAEHPPF